MYAQRSLNPHGVPPAFRYTLQTTHPRRAWGKPFSCESMTVICRSALLYFCVPRQALEFTQTLEKQWHEQKAQELVVSQIESTC